MEVSTTKPPSVMAFAGLDSTGGAGLQADIEAIASMGCHALPVITAITCQDTHDVGSVRPVDALEVVSQARAVLDDIPVSAFKIGLVSSVETVQAIHSILMDYPDVPLVVDPVCVAGGGARLADEEVLNAMVSLLFPQTLIVTPNAVEGRALAPEADSPGAIAQQIMSYGCRYVLITGTHEPGEWVVNRLYSDRRLVESLSWERLEGSYHGSGCTLASAIAARVAHGTDPVAAVSQAQQYTWHSLKHAKHLGGGQYLPDRLYWARGVQSRF
jgi:hydroxymethylpyrimidine/phosphomethylpyrimidine kinase